MPTFSARRGFRALCLGLLLATALSAGTGTAAADEAPSQSIYQTRMLALFEQALTPEKYCELRFLLHLGWRFKQDLSVEELTVFGGKPCAKPTLAEAQAAGFLLIKLPVGFDLEGARAFGRSVGLLADSGANRGAYKHKIAVATRRAAERLQALSDSGRYVFPHLLEIWESPWFRLNFPVDEWVKQDKAWVGNRSAADAMRAFLERGATAECYVGQALCCFAQQYELYGHDWFDRVWHPKDIWVGQPRHIKESPVGRYTRTDVPYRWRALLLDREAQRRDPALGLAAFGPVAFAGASGIVMNQVPGVQSNENFVIVSASQRAVDQIVAGGGLQVFIPPANEAWKQMNDAKGIFKSRRGRRRARRRIDEIFSTPIFKEIKVYVHPYGVVDFACLFKKKMQVADTPTRVVIYTYGREEFCFQRYRAAFKQRCLEELGHSGTVQPASVTDPSLDAMRGPYLPGRPVVRRGAPAPPPPPSGAVVPTSSRR